MASKNANRREVVVIGAGPAGYAAAFLAADLGKKVTMVDPEENPGGVCLHAVKTRRDAIDGAEWGIAFDEPSVDLDALRSWKGKVVDRLTGGTASLAKRRKIERIRGMASFADPHTVKVAGEDGEQTITAESIIVATGAAPRALPILPDDERVWTSKEALDLPSIPERLLVIGAGYIGLELSYTYAGLGSSVEIAEMTPDLMPGADRDLVEVFERVNKDYYEDILLSTTVDKVKPGKKGLAVTFSGDGAPAEPRTYDAILSCVGRVPVTDTLDTNAAGIEITDKGFIRVDSQRRTSQEHIFAVGDVAGAPLLAHKGKYEGRVAARVVAGDDAARYDPHAIPAVEYTEPEIAWCGVTETQAEEEGRKVDVARFPWSASGRAVTMGRRHGLTKLVIEPETSRIIGVGIAGTHAGELIPEGVLAIEMAALAEDLEMTIHPHPTLSETIMEAAARYAGTPTDI